MPDWTLTEQGITGDRPTVEGLQTQLRAEQDNNLLLTESIADLTLQLEDKGWKQLASAVADEFSPAGRKTMAQLCRTVAVSNPMMKGALSTRIGYIWGQGVEIRGTVVGNTDQTTGAADPASQVNDVVGAFLDANTGSLTGSQAHEELERALGTDGNLFFAAFTDPLTGAVKIRSTPADEIADIITNPEDRDEPWFYKRTYAQRTLEAGTDPGTTRARTQTVTVYHPALNYDPASKMKRLTVDGDAGDVRWDAPILHVAVNRLDGWLWGVPDLYASLSWARMYREFLGDWAMLTKSLSKFAWRATGNTRSRSQQVASRVQAAAQGDAGQALVATPDVGLEAVSKSGATIDSDSGKPLAAMVATGLDLPVTVLLADPGVTGARAVAETLTAPTLLAMGMRRLLWQAALAALATYAVERAVTAPRGPLSGTVRIDVWGRRQVSLGGDLQAGIEVDWPPIADTDPVELVQAIVAADGTGKLPPLTTLRLILSALGVKDIDDVLTQVTDDEGNYVDPQITAAADAVEARRRVRTA